MTDKKIVVRDKAGRRIGYRGDGDSGGKAVFNPRPGGLAGLAKAKKKPPTPAYEPMDPRAEEITAPPPEKKR